MATVQVGDVTVAYDVQGSGEPVVLVHGTTGSRMTWMLQTPVLASSWQVVLPEYAGSGETVDPGGPLEVDALAAQVAAVPEVLGHERYHLAGYSLGAVVAAAVAATHPDRVRSLALVCGWATSDAQMHFQFDVWQRLLAADTNLFARYAMADGFTNAFFEMAGDGLDALIAMSAAGLAPGSDRQSELDGRVDISALLPSITAPTLVVAGTRDRFVPVEHSRALAAGIKDAEMVELDCAHLVPVERAEELTQLLRDWFTKH